MRDLINLEVTLFILMGMGVLAKKLKIVGVTGQKNMTDLAIYFILPCNVFNSFLTGATLDVLKECLTVLIISTAIQIFCLFYGKLLYRNQPDGRKQNLQYATTCSNAGFLGNPIAEGVYGSTGLMYASIYLIPLRIMMWSEGLATYSGDKSFKKAFIKVITHPCVISCILGIIVLLTRLPVPEIIVSPIRMVARCNTPICMMIIGMILADIDFKTIIDKTVIWFTINRLILIPLAVFAVCYFIPISQTAKGVSVLLAAMPGGSTTSMLAAKYDRDPAFATKLVVFSTLCSVPALLAWSLILK